MTHLQNNHFKALVTLAILTPNVILKRYYDELTKLQSLRLIEKNVNYRNIFLSLYPIFVCKIASVTRPL
jgi:hypothetical protein